ncbi:MAG TPA: hypothetical protein VJ792_09900 [Candidatus Nitrosotalea sp.]|nr:hypothetical protein [Candidatus Nitrosotalea sp.]
MNTIGGSKKTSTITFRIDDGTINRLRDLSRVQEVSTNTLVNQALRKFIDWDVYLPRSGFVILTKPVLKKIFEHLDEKLVVELATKLGKEEIEDTALFMRGKVDLRSFLSWYETMMLNSSVQTSHVIDGGLHSMVLKHDLGKNWALYHKTILGLVFKEVLHKNVELEYDNNTIRIVFTDDET